MKEQQWRAVRARIPANTRVSVGDKKVMPELNAMGFAPTILETG